MIGDNELYSDTQIDGWNNSDILFFRQRIRALAKISYRNDEGDEHLSILKSLEISPIENNSFIVASYLNLQRCRFSISI